MGNYPQYFDRVQYELYNEMFGSVVIQEPEGWQNDDKEYARHEDYFGVFPKFSNSLKFYDESKELIQLIYDTQGINAEIKLIKLEKHPKTDKWTLTYSGYLDLSTWEAEEGFVSVKFSSGGLEKLLKNREKTKVEIDRKDTLDGVDIEDLNLINVQLDGREIFLHSKWKLNNAFTNLFAFTRSDTTSTRTITVGIPIDLDVRSHEQAHSVLYGSEGNIDRGSVGQMFIGPMDRDRNIRLLINKFSFTPKIIEDGYAYAYAWVGIGKYKHINNEMIRTDFTPLWSAKSRPEDGYLNFRHVMNRENVISNIDLNFSLSENECLSFEIFTSARYHGADRDRFYLRFDNVALDKFEVKEESKFPATETKAILAHELLERLSLIATSNKNSFYSEFFGRTDIGYQSDGVGAYTSVTHGFWARGFDKEPIPQEGPPKIENLFKPLTTSFKDAFDSMAAIWGVGLGIETIGRRERIRVENKKYFFNRNVTIRLPHQVKKVKRSVATGYYYSKLEHGFQQGGAYEEAYGLDEYNTKLEHQTPLIRLEKTYSNVSPYRADGYGLEFCRRKQRNLNDTIDTNYDDNIWLLDLKKYSNEMYLQRKWQDDFEVAPTGIFSPNTATNLRFSPANCLLRNSWYFNSSFWKDLEKHVKYTSSTANSGMVTKLIGKDEIKENQDFLCNDLDISYFVPEWIEFEHLCDFSIMEQIEGTTVINGVEIPNLYGLIEFTNEKNEIERGYLFSLKPNKEGKWKLLKANR